MKLAQTQRLLWKLITAPEGVARALEEEPEDAARLRASVAGSGQGGDASGHGLTPDQRLEVYAGAYFTRIHDALADDFSDLAAQLGETRFHDLVTSYLAICPPLRPSLRDVGERLPQFLAEGVGGLPFRRRAPWAADLARLEWTQLHLFDAPDASLATREDFQRIPLEAWGDARLRLIPAAALLQLEWPVHTLCASWPGARAEESCASLAPAASHILVWRAEETVSYRPLEAEEAGALSRVAGGAGGARVETGTRFGEICELAAQQLSDADAPTHPADSAVASEQAAANEQSAAVRAAGWLARWLGDGLLSADVRPPP